MNPFDIFNFFSLWNPILNCYVKLFLVFLDFRNILELVMLVSFICEWSRAPLLYTRSYVATIVESRIL